MVKRYNKPGNSDIKNNSRGVSKRRNRSEKCVGTTITKIPTNFFSVEVQVVFIHWRSTFFFSQKMILIKTYNTTHNKELLAIIKALQT